MKNFFPTHFVFSSPLRNDLESLFKVLIDFDYFEVKNKVGGEKTCNNVSARKMCKSNVFRQNNNKVKDRVGREGGKRV